MSVLASNIGRKKVRTSTTWEYLDVLLAAASIGADLTAIEALSSTGFPARTTTNTWALRNLAVGSGLTIANPAGVAGNPTISLDTALANYVADPLSVAELASITGSFGTAAFVAVNTLATLANLASTSNALGASLIGVEDAGAYFSTATVEAVLAELGADVAALDQAVVLKGTWNASGGSFPGSGSAQAGWSYIVSVGGTVDGTVFTANDRIIAITDNASTSTYANNWHKLDYTDLVSSVAGRTGAVTLTSSDLTDSGAAGRAMIARADPNADTLYFWDDSAGDYVPVVLPPDLSFSGTSLYVEHMLELAASDETTALTTGTAKATWVFPFDVTITGVGCSVNTAGTGLTVDINESGVSILSTKITLDSGEKTSLSAATPPVISDSTIAAGNEMSVDIDTASGTSKGLKVWVKYRRTT